MKQIALIIVVVACVACGSDSPSGNITKQGRSVPTNLSPEASQMRAALTAPIEEKQAKPGK